MSKSNVSEGSPLPIMATAFRPFFLVRVVAMVGASLTLVAMPLQAYQLTASASLTALLTAVEALPYLLLGLPVGAWSDRWNRRRTMVLPGIVCGVMLLSVPVAEQFVGLTYLHLLLVTAVIATSFVFMDAAAFGAVPQMVGRQRMPEATSALVAASTVTGLVGPPVAGVLASVASPAVVLGVDGIAYLLVAGVTARLRWAGSESTQPKGATTLLDQIREGLGFIWNQPVVRSLTLLGIGGSLAGGAVTGLIVVIGVERFNLAPDDALIGGLYCAVALGALISSWALPRLQRQTGTGSISLAGLAVAGVALTGLAVTGSIVVALALLCAYGAASTTAIVNGITVRQVLAPLHLQGRVNTTARLIAWGGTPVGAIAGGFLADQFGPSAALAAAGGCLLVALALGLRWHLLSYPRLSELMGACAGLGRSG